MSKYQKLELIVDVDKAKAPHYLTTLEGVSEVKRGDYVITGVDHEQWAIKDKWFHSAYKHIGGNKYKRIPQIIDAKVIPNSQIVKAPTGDIRGDKGDYLITDCKGTQWFIKPDIFKKTYMKVSNSTSTTNTAKQPVKSALQKAIDLKGLDTVIAGIPKALRLCWCDVHGHYLNHSDKKVPLCPLCPNHISQGNGGTTQPLLHVLE